MIDPSDATTIIASLSAGKDSTSMLLNLVDTFGADKVLAHYQVIPADWPASLGYNQDLCHRLGVDFVAIQALYEPVSGPKGTEVRRLDLREIHKEADVIPCGTSGIIAGLPDLALRRQWPPGVGVRWCTTYFKRQPLDSWICHNQKRLGAHIVVALGERAAESPRRAKKDVFGQRMRSRRAWASYNWLPVHQWSRRQTFRRIHDAGFEWHPAYAWQGLPSDRALDADEEGGPRVGCRACIYASSEELCHQAEMEANHGVFQRIAEVERSTGRTWWMQRSVFEFLQ